MATITKARRRVLGRRSDSPSNYCQYALGQRERLSVPFGSSALVAADAPARLLAIRWPIVRGVHVAQEPWERYPHNWATVEPPDFCSSSLLSPVQMWVCNVAFG